MRPGFADDEMRVEGRQYFRPATRAYIFFEMHLSQCLFDGDV